jgi:hypothetical protein
MERIRRAGVTAFWMATTATVIILRRPDSVLNAQFWAEDGRNFFAEAYNHGALAALFIPYNGYLHVVPRLAAGIATIAPLALAPLVMNAVAIIIQTLPALVLASRRMAAAFPDRKVRVALALLYLVGPGTAGEINANVSNSQWHLAVLAWCLIATSSARSARNIATDAAILAFTGLSGPFALLLIPFAAISSWMRERRIVTLNSCVLLACAVIQVAVVALSGTRQVAELDASLAVAGEILSCQIFMPALLGAPVCAALGKPAPIALLAIVVCGVAAVSYGAIKGPVAIRMFVAFAGLTLVTSVAAPLTSWPNLAVPGSSMRYWFIPILAVEMVVTWLWAEVSFARRFAGYAAMSVLAFGIALNWQQLPLEDFRFREAARWFGDVPSGTVAAISINPPGWEMVLLKR